MFATPFQTRHIQKYHGQDNPMEYKEPERIEFDQAVNIF